jgi:glutaredoxin-like protein NrdH
MVEKKHKPGKKKAEIVIYALSTCIWCRKTKKLLDDLGVDYYFIDVDLVENADDKTTVQNELLKWNPDKSFPTIVIDNKECIRGYDEDRIREVCK